MLYFATLFNINYLSRGLALLNSLTQHSSQTFKLFILALDEDVVNYFEANPAASVSVIRLSEIENYYPELIIAKENRSTVEFFFTLSPYLPLYILNKYPEINQITSMDADIYFFDDPAKIFNTYPDASVLITPHNFSDNLQHLLKYGKYNVSFQSFKNDKMGLACLEDWKQNCFNWCHDYFDEANEQFADQKYLDTWAAKFDNVQDINLSGAGAAPWNIGKFTWQVIKGKVLVSSEVLIYYHFHNLRLFNRYFAFNGLEAYQVNANGKPIKHIYLTYLNKLKSLSAKQVTVENKILRNNSLSKSGVISKLKSHDGYWLFNSLFITHLNPRRRVNTILKYIWPG